MLEDRNINRPSYVLALLLGIVALLDAQNALTLMQAPDAGAAWFIDLLTSGVCAALATFLLLRPHLYIFGAAVGWSFVAFLANFIMKQKGFDTLATERMVLYFVVFVGAGVLTIIEGWKWWEIEKAKRPVAPPMGQPWAGQPWQGQYGAPQGYPQQPGYPPQQPPQYAPPPPAAPPAAPAPPAPPAPPAGQQG